MKLIAVFAVATLACAQTFEVASIHPNVTGTEGSVIDLPETGRLRVTNATLKTLVRAAYGIQNDQISGGPKWLDTDRYDIEARTSRPITEDQDQPLLQNLLADRFRLKVHREQRELTVYGLMLAKNGPLIPKEHRHLELHPHQPRTGRESHCRHRNFHRPVCRHAR